MQHLAIAALALVAVVLFAVGFGTTIYNNGCGNGLTHAAAVKWADGSCHYVADGSLTGNQL